ncbi:hypothetical protein SELMODRAFT_448732 [Selaginella moellendorffii]|uniref:Uncharacterized protein n=1 Tax=Selaginella moellendorffii TaxID=88036 RepID=D8T9S6_SELML|nr:hypothetical protein SELMODRAFT_448732 [Selaginella moellendorffii]
MRCFGCDPDGAPRGEVAVRRFWESIPSATTAPCVCIVPRKAVTPAVIVSRVPGPQTYKRRVQIELDTVTLQRGTAFLHSKKNKLIVRRVYLDFASLAINILLGKVKGRRGNVDNFIVAGTPGTGKTYFGYYLLMQLRNHPAFVNRELIWEESTIDGPGLSFFFRGNEVVEGVVGAFDSRRTEDTVFLCNGPLLRPQHTLSQVVMFSSNKDEAKFTRQFIKDTVCAVVYMPLWDLGELALLYASAGLMNNPGDFTSLKGLFDFWGGSARAVFDTFDDPDYVSRFETALRNARNHKDLDIRLMWGQTQMTWPCEVSVVGIPADFPVNIMHQIPLFGDEETRDSSDGSKRPIGADATDHGVELLNVLPLMEPSVWLMMLDRVRYLRNTKRLADDGRTAVENRLIESVWTLEELCGTLRRWTSFTTGTFVTACSRCNSM